MKQEKTIKDLKELYKYYSITKDISKKEKDKREEKWGNLSRAEKQLIHFAKNRYSFKNYIETKLIIEDLYVTVDNSFVEVLEKYNVNEFVFADNSSGALKELIYFIDNGFKINQTIVYAYDYDDGNEYKGLLLEREV